MDQSILDAISKALPAMQMDVLRNELQRASEYEGLKQLNGELSSTIARQSKENVELTKKLIEHETLDTKRSILEAKERALDIELLKIKVSCAEEKYAAVKDLAYAAFRNPTVQKSYNRHVGIPSGGYQNLVSESETQTVE